MLQPGRCHLPTAPKIRHCDLEALAYSAAQIAFSLRLMARLTAARRTPSLLTIDPTSHARASHCPVIALVVNTAVILTIDRASSSGRQTRQRHASSIANIVILFIVYLRRIFSPDSTERRIILKLRVRHRVLSASSRDKPPRHDHLVSPFSPTTSSIVHVLYTSLHHSR